MNPDFTATKNAGYYADINGIKMYYEIHGAGRPLVLIHGGGSTITTTFGSILPLLAEHHYIIAVELQAHGRTGDRHTPESFEQDAADIAGLLTYLDIPQADLFGFSNGGHTAMKMAITYPDRVRRLIIASAFYKKEGMPAGFWEGMAVAKFSDMPQVYKDAFLLVNKDEAALLNMFHKDAQRMQTFEDWPEHEIGQIRAPAMIVTGDRDLATPEHTVEMYRLFRNSRLAVFPGNHGSFMGEAMSPDPGSKIPALFAEMIGEFLSAEY